MLDKALNKHIDVMDSLEEQFKEEIDLIIKNIDKDALFVDPHGTMQLAVEDIKQLMTEKYIAQAEEEGLNLAKLLERYDDKGKEIPVDPSKNPTENAEVVQ